MILSNRENYMSDFFNVKNHHTKNIVILLHINDNDNNFTDMRRACD